MIFSFFPYLKVCIENMHAINSSFTILSTMSTMNLKQFETLNYIQLYYNHLLSFFILLHNLDLSKEIWTLL